MHNIIFYSVKNANFIKEVIVLLQNLLNTHNKIDVVVEPNDLEGINSALWSLNSFFPHCLADDKYAEHTNIVLHSSQNYIVDKNYVVLLNNATHEATCSFSVVFNAMEEKYLVFNRKRYKDINENNVNGNINLQAVNIL